MFNVIKTFKFNMRRKRVMKKILKIISVMLVMTGGMGSVQAQWIQQQVPVNTGIILSVDFTDEFRGITGGWHGGFFNFNGKALCTSDEGTTWIQSIVPDSSRSFVTVTFVDSLTGFMAGAYNLFSAERFKSNINNLERKGFSRSFIKHLENIGVRAFPDYKGFFVKTTDGGRNWFTFGTLPSEISYLVGMDFLDVNTGFATTLIQDSTYQSATILKTTNGGLTWSEALSIDTVWEFGSIEFIDSNNIIAVGRGGSFDSISSNTGGMIFKSTDQGINWTLQFFRYVEFTDVRFTDITTGFASASKWGDGLVYKTTNQGINWNLIYTQSGNVLIEGIKFYKGSGTGMIYGYYSDLNIYSFTRRTTDYGDSWGQLQLLDTTGQNLLTGGVMISQKNQYITGGNPFNQGAIYHTTNGGVVFAGFSGNSFPGKFFLSQNYPNPFNPATNLEFGISDLGFVSLKVYDILGKEVVTLVNEKLSPGKYKVEFDGSGLSSGVYFYRLTADDFIDTKRMLLIK